MVPPAVNQFRSAFRKCSKWTKDSWMNQVKWRSKLQTHTVINQQMAKNQRNRSEKNWTSSSWHSQRTTRMARYLRYRNMVNLSSKRNCYPHMGKAKSTMARKSYLNSPQKTTRQIQWISWVLMDLEAVKTRKRQKAQQDHGQVRATNLDLHEPALKSSKRRPKRQLRRGKRRIINKQAMLTWAERGRIRKVLRAE